MQEKVFKIGELSKLTNVPVKTIRYYDELGLLAPSFVDKYTGYRYYDEENMKKLLQIIFLKKLGYRLENIKSFDENVSLNAQKDAIEKEIANLKEKLSLINSLQKMKGEKIMKPFENDEQAIGKWKYVASAMSVEDYQNGNSYFENDVFLQELYFLDGGQGYWIFERWTKGFLFHFSGQVFEYNIIDGKLFLKVFNDNNEFEIVLIYEKENSNHYNIEDLLHKDNIDLPFEKDTQALGFWQVCDYIDFKNKNNYKPKQNNESYFLKSLTIQPNGECVFDSTNGIFKRTWTKNYIIDKQAYTAANYTIKEIDGNTYLIMDWKSGAYIFAGKISGCYVFKKIN